MNGIEKITQRIAAEAEAECGRITAEAEQRCAAIKAEYDAKAAQVYESAMAKGKQEIEQLSSREEGTVRMDAKKDLLLLKQELVREAFSRAKEKLLALSREEYTDFAAKLAAAAASTGTEEIILSEKDAGELGTELAAKANALLQAMGKMGELRLSAETRELDGGLILRSGSVETNRTLDTLLEQVRSTSESEVAGILFG